VCPPPSVIVFIYFIYNIIHYYYYVGRPYTAAPLSYIVVSYTFMRSGKRDQTIYYLYTILCILYYAYTTGLISMEITPLFVLILQHIPRRIYNIIIIVYIRPAAPASLRFSFYTALPQLATTSRRRRPNTVFTIFLIVFFLITNTYNVPMSGPMS